MQIKRKTAMTFAIAVCTATDCYETETTSGEASYCDFCEENCFCHIRI
jgi:hypothetical protein